MKSSKAIKKKFRTRFLKLKTYQKILLVTLGILAVLLIANLISGNTSEPFQDVDLNSDENMPTTSPSESNNPEPLETPKPNIGTSPSTSPSATTSSNSPVDCSSYNLTSNTGSVKIQAIPTSGNISGSMKAELSAKSGCKVLDGKSTDIQSLIGGNPISYSSVPPGSYTARVIYNGNWSTSASVTVTAGQLTSVNVSVAGSQSSPTSAPTPDPAIPVCTTPLVLPSSNGTAPFTPSICPGVGGNPPGGTAGFTTRWDFNGDGTWDADADLSCLPYTYNTAGTYTIRMYISNSSGQQSDICTKQVLVN